jgi:hypothetical protein
MCRLEVRLLLSVLSTEAHSLAHSLRLSSSTCDFKFSKFQVYFRRIKRRVTLWQRRSKLRLADLQILLSASVLTCVAYK